MTQKQAAQVPSLGRIVLVRTHDRLINEQHEHAAMITQVWSETTINVMVFPGDANCFGLTSVQPMQDGQGTGYSWRWPPYVRGSHKTETVISGPDVKITAPAEVASVLSTLALGDAAAAAVATAPRVALADIHAAVAQRYDLNANDIVAAHGQQGAEPLKVLSLCVLVLTNGFTVVGKSAPASPVNFDAELGKTFAYEDAVRQIWPLMGFALRDRLHREQHATA